MYTLRSLEVLVTSKLLMILVVLCMSGCSNKAIYDETRRQGRYECLKEPPSAYSECIERTNKTYEEYKRQRKELLDKK